jgi:ABC-2 type transport system permease protein
VINLEQLTAIAWAQFRTSRNHFPRTTVGAVVGWVLYACWYALFAGLAVLLVMALPRLPLAQLRQWMPTALLAVFGFWQLVPLFTLSTGWSLQLNKLQIYPVSNATLFWIETLLRFSTAPEMVIVMTGAVIGLLRHDKVPLARALLLVLFVPLNLFLSLYLRDLILRAFDRNRFRELFAVIIISISVVPQLLLRTPAGHKVEPYVLRVAQSVFLPWREVSDLALGFGSLLEFLLFAAWLSGFYALARYQFLRSLAGEEPFRPDVKAGTAARPVLRSSSVFAFVNRIFSDPLASLVQRELQSLLRMPRFRVILGLATVFSVGIFVPLTLSHPGGGRGGFINENFPAVTTLYGLLLLSDALLLNVFGFDRRATQIYFIAPVSFATVLRAKNLVAGFFIALQTAAVLLLAALGRGVTSPSDIANALGSAAVMTIFLLSVGNLSSTRLARPMDPRQTFKKQAGGKMQLWLVLCSVGMFLLIGSAFLAKWAFQSEWAFLAILALELIIGCITYRIATDSAVEYALREKEQLVDALSRGSAPVGLGE